MSDCRCRIEDAVLVARPGRVWVEYHEHNPRPGEVPLGKPCRCDDCNESDEPPREAYGNLYPVPDDLALWECSVCGEFSMWFAHLHVADEWLDRDHPYSHMVEKANVVRGTIPVVVLDLDGVANHQPLYDANFARGTPTPPEGWLDRECIARINSLCERTGARIVISSSWRTYATIRGQPVGGLVGTVAVLRACGLTAEVIGATPDHTTPEQRAREERADRWPEIHAWLAAHPEVGAWVALDDSDLPGVPAESFVRTDIAVGLTDADVERAVRVLSAPAVTFDRP